MLTMTLCGALSVVACVPTPYVAQKHVRYDFRTEGFLSPHMLQTIGRAEGTEMGTRQHCLERALEIAVHKAVRVMLHTRYEIPPDSGVSTTPGQPAVDEFERSYPFRFTPRDYVRALYDYDSLLHRSYLALQDSRSRLDCTVVLRIEAQDLPAQIRSVRLTFVPEGLRGRAGQKYSGEKGKNEADRLYGKVEGSGR